MSTISEAITQDHRELEKYYNEVVNSSDHDHQERFGNQFVWELARHSIGEELIVYPAFEKYIGKEGKEKADKDREEHHKVRAPCPRSFVTDYSTNKETIRLKRCSKSSKI